MSIWDVSIEFANKVYTYAWIALVVGAVLTAVATMTLFWASAIRDKYADEKIATAQEGAANANERAGVLEAKTADLQRQTAEANLKAEQERLARTKIEERLAGRSISVETSQAIVNAIKSFSGTPADIFVTGSGVPEIDALANRIGQILTAANWSPVGWSWTGIGALREVIVFTRTGAERATIDAANALAASLNTAGIATQSGPWPGEWKSFGGMLNGPDFDSTRSSIRIVVGAKPE